MVHVLRTVSTMLAGSMLLLSCDVSSRVADLDNASGGQSAEVGRLSPDACPYLQSFVMVRKRATAMPAAAALPILYRYAADPGNDNPEACQSVALDAEIATREMSLATIRLSDGRSIKAQASYRCDLIEPRTTACNGAVEDATARPFQAGIKPIELNEATSATVVNGLPGATLLSIHRIRVAQSLDGGQAVRLPTNAAVRLGTSGELMAIVAIYTGARPWKFRKVVWYYH
jgi:hypothetical protein